MDTVIMISAYKPNLLLLSTIQQLSTQLAAKLRCLAPCIPCDSVYYCSNYCCFFADYFLLKAIASM